MYKKFAVILALIFVISTAYAAKHGRTSLPSKGRVTAGSLSIHAKPSSSSEIQGLLGRGSSVTILGKNGSWYKIKLMDGGAGYVQVSAVSTGKQTAEKTATKTKKQARQSAEGKQTSSGSALPAIKSMLNKFNNAVLNSDFADEKKIVPGLSVAESKSNNSITLIYSAMDQSGKKVPSLLDNPLAKNMRELVELSFLKMLKAGRAGNYEIFVDSPYFGEGGKINGSVHYVIFTLKADDKDITALEHNKISVWNLIKSSKKLGDVFAAYPH